MRVVALSDTHNRHRDVLVPHGDIVIHAGDACVNGTPEEMLDFVQWFSALPHKHRIFIGGNHDGIIANADWREEAIGSMLRWSARGGGTLYLEGETASVATNGVDLRIHGAPWRPRPNDWTPGEPMRPGKRTSAFGVRENLIGQFWDTVPEGLDILVTHVPAYNVLDEIDATPMTDALRIGCTALAARLDRLTCPPRLHIFGHVHDPGGQRMTTPTGMRAHNVAICDAKYNPTHKPQVIDL